MSWATKRQATEFTGSVGRVSYLLPDLLPDDPGHLIAVQFDNRVLDHDLVLYSHCNTDSTGAIRADIKGDLVV